MTSPHVDTTHLDLRASLSRMDREIARLVRERDAAIAAVAALLRACPVDADATPAYHAAWIEGRRVIGEIA